MGILGKSGKLGILAKMIEIAKKVIFGESVEIGYTAKLAKMTDLCKSVKNSYFLTVIILGIYQGVESSPSG